MKKLTTVTLLALLTALAVVAASVTAAPSCLQDCWDDLCGGFEWNCSLYQSNYCANLCGSGGGGGGGGGGEDCEDRPRPECDEDGAV